METKIQILIIDDDKNLAENLCDIMEEEGYAADYALNGSSAVLKYRDNAYDIAFVDVKLPDISGNEVVKQIRELSPETECIIMTGHASLESAINAVQQHMVISYEVKPLDMNHILLLVSQIGKRKNLEKQLSEQKDFLKYIINSMPGIFYAIDEKGQFLYWNDTLEQQSGFSNQQIHTKTPLDFFTGESRENMKRVIEAAFTDGYFEIDEKLTTKNGEQKPFLFSGKRVLFQNQKYLVGMGIDLSERKKLEEQFRQSQKMQVIGQLAGGIAHDFNNMLNVITGYAELAFRQLDPADPLYKNLKMIENAAKRSADLTRQLLAFSRKQVISPKPADINTLIMDLQKMIGRLIGENIELVFSPGKDIWTIKIDHSQVDQVTINLAVNAADAMPNGGKLIIETANVTLNDTFCSNYTKCVPGQYVMIKVSDNGKGMTAETLSHIFEPFFTTKEPGKGTGLGLSTVYGIIKQNRGIIDVNSKPDCGTQFNIYIPRWIGNVQQSEGLIEKTTTSVTATILLVEDDDMVRELTEDILRSIGCIVTSAASPNQALEYCKGGNIDFDLLITDVIMPKMSGKELRNSIEVIKPGIKTLYMSGYPANSDIREDILNGQVDFIQKPFNIDQLTKKVQEMTC